MAMGSSSAMSSPARVNCACGLTLISTSASPASLPRRAGRALALQAQHLPVRYALGDREVEHPAVRHGHPLLGARGGFQEVDLQRVAHVAAARGEGPVRLSPARAPPEEVGEDVAEAEVVAGPAAAGAPAERPGSARVRALEAAAGLAVGVDLAAVVLLALHRIADDVVGGGDLLEPLLGGGLVDRIEIGMQLLGQLAIGAANLFVRRVARHAQHLVGVLGHLVASPSSPAASRILTQESWRACANPPAFPFSPSFFTTGRSGYRLTRISGSRSSSSARAAKRRRRRSPSSAA